MDNIIRAMRGYGMEDANGLGASWRRIQLQADGANMAGFPGPKSLANGVVLPENPVKPIN